MSLEMEQIAPQIAEMAANLKANLKDRNGKLTNALVSLHNIATDQERLKNKIEASKTSWLVAGLNELIDLRQQPIQCPQNYQVLACDGSHIDVDRHYSAHCFLINIGLVQLKYGDQPDALLSSQSRLYFRDDEIKLISSDGRQFSIEGQILGLKRAMEECHALADCIKGRTAGVPMILLLDGSLILWGTGDQQTSEFLTQEYIVNGFLKYLDTIFELSKQKELALGSYISFPRSTEVVNALRIFACPYEQANCDNYCQEKIAGKPCEIFDGLLDRDIFQLLLNNGERSALFQSRSSVVKNYYGKHLINFFYLKLEDEIVRIEIPFWVVEKIKLVEFLHTVILSQCKSGFGYPVALSEAHDKAVVTGGDREQFWLMVEQILAEDNIKLNSSAKQWSKKRKWV